MKILKTVLKTVLWDMVSLALVVAFLAGTYQVVKMALHVFGY
jgi:hypothetical protein